MWIVKFLLTSAFFALLNRPHHWVFAVAGHKLKKHSSGIFFNFNFIAHHLKQFAQNETKSSSFNFQNNFFISNVFLVGLTGSFKYIKIFGSCTNLTEIHFNSKSIVIPLNAKQGRRFFKKYGLSPDCKKARRPILTHLLIIKRLTCQFRGMCTGYYFWVACTLTSFGESEFQLYL